MDRLQAPSLDPPIDLDTFVGYIEGAINTAIYMKVAFEMDEEAEVNIAGAIESFESAKEAHQARMVRYCAGFGFGNVHISFAQPQRLIGSLNLGFRSPGDR